MGYLRSMAPELLAKRTFKCSETFVRHFLEVELGWSWRTATRAAQKTPDGWERECEDMLLRVVWEAFMDRTPAEAILNGDQTGVNLIPTGNKTWATRGAKQVNVFGKDEKRQFTLMVTTSCSGAFLPLQSIWSGKTSASLPAANLRVEAEKDGNIWSSGGDNHWSNLSCMKEVSVATTF